MQSKFTPSKPRFQSTDQTRENKFQEKKTYTRTRFSSEKSTTIYPNEGEKTGKHGKVKISLKNSVTNEKKSGALSPRAPEKIRHNRATEMKIYGENACHTLFQQRPEAIVRLWATVEGAKKAGELLHYLAENKKAYHIVDREEMEKVTGTEHHGEICLLVKKGKTLTLEGYLQLARQRDCVVLLDNVNNAQNIGSIVRTCAFYGVKGIIVEQNDALYSSNTARVAEGGLEFVYPLETKHKQIALTQLRQAGYQIIHLTRNKQAKNLTQTALSEKVVFVLSEIISNEIIYPEDTVLQLSTVNPLNSSLNVAVNTGILLNQWYLQQK